MCNEPTPITRRVVSEVFTLFDDESMHEKCTVLTKLEAAIDDLRNPQDDFNAVVEAFMQFGKRYRIVIEEVDDGNEMGV